MRHWWWWSFNAICHQRPDLSSGVTGMRLAPVPGKMGKITETHQEARPAVIIHHSSSFIVHRSSFIVHRSSFIVHHSSFIIHHSSSIIHHSSFIIHHHHHHHLLLLLLLFLFLLLPHRSENNFLICWDSKLALVRPLAFSH